MSVLVCLGYGKSAVPSDVEVAVRDSVIAINLIATDTVV
jgi:hypothetical protein